MVNQSILKRVQSTHQNVVFVDGYVTDGTISGGELEGGPVISVFFRRLGLRLPKQLQENKTDSTPLRNA